MLFVQLSCWFRLQDANESDIKVQVCIYAFDLLYINGESLVSQPLRHRREVLRSSFPEVRGEFMFASSLVTNDTDRVAEYLEESIKGKSTPMFIDASFCGSNVRK